VAYVGVTRSAFAAKRTSGERRPVADNGWQRWSLPLPTPRTRNHLDLEPLCHGRTAGLREACVVGPSYQTLHAP
jgi:hypothetical protein